MIISKRFEKHPGYKMVQSRHYAIEDDGSGHELSRDSDFVECLHPGQKIDMSMIFFEGDTNSNNCPRCRTKPLGLTGSRVQWHVNLSELGLC
jgi:hypothetical protein